MSADWRAVVAGIGYADAELIGQGMESAVVRLGDGLVGKVWTQRSAEELVPIQAFYSELAAQGLPFTTPQIVQIRNYQGVGVSIERELAGTSLKTAMGAGRIPVTAAQDATVEVAAALRSTTAGPATRGLPTMDEDRALWSGHMGWGLALAGLVERRAARFADVLRAAIPDFDRLLCRVLDLLSTLPPAASDQIVHGDICPENILVDDAGRPTALLDWGFLTTAGDNAFDAATAAGFFDMYGPDARAHDDGLLKRMADLLGYPRDRMLLYRAAYAIAGANAYSAVGEDGHFEWCARTFERADVAASLR